MVCYYFPPLGGIGSLRALKFAAYLPEFGWQPTVLAPRHGAYHRDESLSFPEGQVVRTASLELSRAGKRALRLGGGDTTSAAVGGGGTRALRDLVRRWLYRPDAQIGWYPFAVAAGRAALERQRCHVVFSSSFPITAHLVARRVARDFSLPWVAEFRDPWTDRVSYDSEARRRRDRRTEDGLLRDADAVVTVSPSWADRLRARGTPRVEVITNGFDPLDYSGGAPEGDTVVSYLGTYYPDRQDLGTALRALAQLRRDGYAGLRVRFVGPPPPPALRQLIAEEGLLPFVENTGVVPHGEALRALSGSSLLLLAGPVAAGATGDVERGAIAAKVFEYLGAGRPVLYVGDLDTDVVRLLRPLGGTAFASPGDVAGALRGARELLASDRRPDPLALRPFSRRALTRRLAALFDEVSRA
jgi:glycosyltransferase involved in cell wall biosynthesis